MNLKWIGLLGWSLAWAAGIPAQEAPAPVFTLGEVLVVGAEDGGHDGTAARVTGAQAEQRASRNLAEAAALAPGVTLTRVGGRNEEMAYVRGFDTRQVPLFLDGIPVYVPFDGNFDMGRFGVFDLGGLSVYKGYSPAILGPNTLGGAINVVTLRPTQPEELLVRAGVSSGRGFDGALRGGLLRPNGYAQAGVSWRERDSFRVSSDFEPTETEDGGRRGNSDSRDLQVGAKLAWTPGDAGNEFAVAVVRQDGEKGVPVYAGSDPRVPVRYWRYTEWIKNSLYALGNVELGRGAYLKPRLYYDTYENTVKAYDDDTYTTQERRSSFTSIYDDYTFGGSLEAGLPAGERNQLRGAAHYKQDVHRERNAGERQYTMRDETVALGLEDRLRLTETWSLTGGASLEWRRSLQAEDPGGGEDFGRNENTVFNPQAGLLYSLTGGTFRATVARKSRFPTLKDRYSYRLGTALPNPDLEPETAMHYEAGYDGRATEHLRVRGAVFYSRLEDTIQRVDNVAQDDDGAWLYQVRNTGESEQAGVEAGIAWTVVEDLTAGADYMYLRRKNLNQPDLKPVDAPAHSLTLFGEWQPLPRLTVVPSVEYNSSRYSTSDGVKADGFWLCHLHAQWELPRGVELHGGVRNILDTNYELNEGYSEEGRSLYAGVQYRF